MSRWSIMMCTMRIASSNVLLQIAVTSLISWMRWSEKYSVQERRPVYSTSWVMEVGFFIFLVCKVYTNMECMMTRRRATDTADSCLKERIWILVYGPKCVLKNYVQRNRTVSQKRRWGITRNWNFVQIIHEYINASELYEIIHTVIVPITVVL